MSGRGLFQRRVRGFRVIEVIAMGLLWVTALAVYLGKTGAGGERADIAQVERDIGQEHRRLKVLRAEVAYLEQPERIERLSEQYLGLQPVAEKHETPPEALPDIARAGLSAPAPAGQAKASP